MRIFLTGATGYIGSAVLDALLRVQRVSCARARALGWSSALHSVGSNVPRLLEEFRRAQERAA
jgi:uncharacterized protein YbjT (DUF2867 family)